MSKIYRVPVDELARRWAEVEPILKRSTDRGGYMAPVHVLQFVFAGKMEVWLAVNDDDQIDGVITATVQVYPLAKVCQVTHAAGRKGTKAWWAMPMYEAVKEAAQACGCTQLVNFGRPGWAKYGGKIDKVIITVDLAP